METAKSAVKVIVNMLRPTDRIAVAAFSSDVEHSTMTSVNCQSTRLSMATAANKEALSNFVSTLQPGGLTYYTRGLQYTREFFLNSELPPGGESSFSPRKPVLIFISDGTPTDSSSQIMNAQKNLMDQVPNLVIMTYGLDMTGVILQDMAVHDYAK
jgi:hypothetical protein